MKTFHAQVVTFRRDTSYSVFQDSVSARDKRQARRMLKEKFGPSCQIDFKKKEDNKRSRNYPPMGGDSIYF